MNRSPFYLGLAHTELELASYTAVESGIDFDEPQCNLALTLWGSMEYPRLPSSFLAYLLSGIIATTLGHDTFKLYMYGPTKTNAALSGAVVSVYNAGQAIGSLCTGALADWISRRWTIFVAALFAIIGTAIQAGAMSIGMLIAGRAIGGIACGQLLSVVPIYIAEISPPTQRGFLVGLQGMAIAIGFCVANWIGYGGSFAMGDAQWRIPLAMQIPGALCLAIGVCFIPYTPRWLVQKDRVDDASRVLRSIHGDDDLVAQELIQIGEQIHLEKLQVRVSWIAALRQLFSRQYIRRTSTATFILAMSQLSGSSVIQNFQNIFYAAVGFKGQQALLISGVYGLMGVFGQAFYLFIVADRWPRVRTLSIGSVVLSVLIAVCMALSAVYGSADSTNLNGAHGAIAFIFIYSAAFAVFFNGTVWVVCSELFPFFLRSRGIAISVFFHSVVAIVLSQITPVALAEVSWRYYSLFIATNLTAGLIYFFFLPETAGKSLEEVGELFGDVLATDHIGDIDVAAKTSAVELEDIRHSPSSQGRSKV
ncbi:hypothetical protein PG997_014841 [Apiospora hydei]|uniref:Major facilitator superfamily (MFS) profile domain-containing protein n=1 Tax=Apiospora hydei TaxID=1337664 RepID=A0ABR1UUZ0_9PEZI